MSPSPWAERIVHLPRPEAFGDASQRHAELLRDVRYLLLVGSLRRPRKIAEKLGLEHLGTYVDDIVHPHLHDREFNVEILDLGTSPPARVAVASHGIGVSGVEIVLVELFSLLNLVLAPEDRTHLLCGVGRSGTRGGLRAFEYGTVGLSTASFSDTYDCALPDPRLLELATHAARKLGHPFALGPGISTSYFWAGQGRQRPSQQPVPPPLAERLDTRAQDLLWRWVERGIDFVEMEDHAVHDICTSMGIPSISAGAVIAQRYDPAQQRFVLDYDAEAKKRSELWPAEVLLHAFREHWAQVTKAGGPAAFFEHPAGV